MADSLSDNSSSDTGESEGWLRNVRIPDAKEVFVGELAERGEWIVANIQTRSVWPVTSQKVRFRGECIWIIPIMKDHFPAVAINKPPGKSREQCEELLMRFVSNLSWVENDGFLIEGIGGGSLPAPMGRSKQTGFSICDEFDLSYFPEPTEPKALLALALMREGRGLNHPGYSFLSLYRVLEVALGQGKKKQTEWINAKISAGLDHHHSKKSLEELISNGVNDIGAHLYESGRCAIAHASHNPIIDPDDPADARRLWSERPLMLRLAELAIEEHFGVETSHTVYRKHLYELDGFKKILGPELVGYLVRGEDVAEERMVDIPDINVQLRRHAPYLPLACLSIKALHREKHALVLDFASKDELVFFRIRLDFSEERLHFNLFTDLRHRDDGSAKAAVVAGEVSRFSKDYFGNGQLRISDAETSELLSRKDAFIPVNMYQDHIAANAEISRWMSLAEERRNRDAKYGEELVRYSKPYLIKIGKQ